MSDPRCEASVRESVSLCLSDSDVGRTIAIRIGPTVVRAALFFERLDLISLQDVRPSDAAAFVNARLESGLPASVSTKHNRRTDLRLLFRVARRLGLADGDPTVDLVLPPRSSLPTRPLDDHEVELCRDVAWWTSSRVAAIWALAEATVRGAEIAAISTSHVDPEGATVRIAGGSRTASRTGSLSGWGVAAIRRQLEMVGHGHLVFAGSDTGMSGQVSTSRAIGSVLVRAGLAAEPDVRPSSVAGWAGRRVLDATGRIEAAAKMLGVRSLDVAARMVGHDWNDR